MAPVDGAGGVGGSVEVVVGEIVQEEAPVVVVIVVVLGYCQTD